MSQKIDGGITAGAPVRQVVTPTRTAAVGDGSAGPVEAVDSLRLTGEATSLQALQRELSTAPAMDSARVQAVREALENGSYQIKPEAIAQRMLDLDQLLQA
ncbi:MAG: flagellar biosynthesis anti-sigma factor FlgM [Stenotrophomonas sp.]